MFEVELKYGEKFAILGTLLQNCSSSVIGGINFWLVFVEKGRNSHSADAQASVFYRL